MSAKTTAKTKKKITFILTSFRKEAKRKQNLSLFYLNRDGKWTTCLAKATRFKTIEALEQFAAKYGIEILGIFGE